MLAHCVSKMERLECRLNGELKSCACLLLRPLDTLLSEGWQFGRTASSPCSLLWPLEHRDQDLVCLLAVRSFRLSR